MNKKTIDKETEARILKKLSEKYKGTGDPKEEYERLMKILDDTSKSSGRKGYEKERYYYDQGEHEEPEKPEISKFQSFFSIWFRPRETIRSIVDSRPFWSVLMLAVISPILISLLIGYSTYFSQFLFSKLYGSSIFPFISIPKIWIYLLLIVLGVFIGLLVLYILSALLTRIGRGLGGQGTSAEARIVIAWSQIPLIIMLLIDWIVTLVYTNPSISMKLISGTYHADLSEICLICGIEIIIYALIGWSFITFIIGLSEIHRFSKGEAFINAIIASTILAFILYILEIIIAYVRGILINQVLMKSAG